MQWLSHGSDNRRKFENHHHLTLISTNSAISTEQWSQPDPEEHYRLSEIFSIIPEFEGAQISLGTFLTACYSAYNIVQSCSITHYNMLRSEIPFGDSHKEFKQLLTESPLIYYNRF